MNLCRNMPIIKKEKGGPIVPQPADEEMEQVAAAAITDLNDLDEDTCYCCFEKKDTAHVRY